MKQCYIGENIYHQVIHGMLVVINRFIVNMFSFLTFPPMQTYQPFFSWGKRKMKILCVSIVKKSIHSGWTESWEYILTVLLFVIHNFFLASIGWLFPISIDIFICGREKAWGKCWRELSFHVLYYLLSMDNILYFRLLELFFVVLLKIRTSCMIYCSFY